MKFTIPEERQEAGSGYTLLEVMVALIIIGISITAVTGALSTSTGLSARADYAIESVRIMKNILNNPELMNTIVENKNFDKVLDDEDGWTCHAETKPLVLNSADLEWNSDHEQNSDKRESSKKIATKRKKISKGEEIEVPGMVEVTLCVRQTSQLLKKEYCLSIWKRQKDSINTQITTKTVQTDSKLK